MSDKFHDFQDEETEFEEEFEEGVDDLFGEEDAFEYESWEEDRELEDDEVEDEYEGLLH